MRLFEQDEKLIGIGFDMLFSQLYKIMVNKVNFEDFRGFDHPRPVYPPLHCRYSFCNNLYWLVIILPSTPFTH